MAQDRIADEVRGVVTCSNPKGFKVEGHEDWLNWSKFAAAIEPPTKGERIVAGLDKAGFVREAPAPGEPVAPLGPADRETRITRMASLNTATAILTSGGQVAGVDAVLELAGRLEAWVSR